MRTFKTEDNLIEYNKILTQVITPMAAAEFRKLSESSFQTQNVSWVRSKFEEVNFVQSTYVPPSLHYFDHCKYDKHGSVLTELLDMCVESSDNFLDD